MAIRVVVFDLDGTLVDSLRDIAESLNECLELLGIPGRPVEAYRYMVGEGIPKLCERAIGEDHPELVARLIELARPRYRARRLEHTRPYAGVSELVGTLRAGGYQLAVLSNKPHEMTARIVHTFWPVGTFVRVQGYTEERYRKPDPYYLDQIARECGVSVAETVLVGDTPTDLATAARAGAPAIGVTWGFRTAEDLRAAGAVHLASAPGAVEELLRKLAVDGGADRR